MGGVIQLVWRACNNTNAGYVPTSKSQQFIEVGSSGFVWANVVRSAWKLFIFNTKNIIYRIKVSQRYIWVNLENNITLGSPKSMRFTKIPFAAMRLHLRTYILCPIKAKKRRELRILEVRMIKVDMYACHLCLWFSQVSERTIMKMRKLRIALKEYLKL